MSCHSIDYSDQPGDESSPLISPEPMGERPHWPRNRELGWLIPNGLKFPPPVLPRSLRALQADLDSAWMELERQHVIANRINLLTTSMALLITSSGGLTTALASSKGGRVWTTMAGLLTTLAGTVMGGIRAMGQPRRAEDRVRRLERIVEHIGRLYYSVGPAGPAHDRAAIEQTWRMIDEEEDRSEREERLAGHFGSKLQPDSPPSPVDCPPQSDNPIQHVTDSPEPIRPRLKMKRASTLLGNHYSQ